MNRIKIGIRTKTNLTLQLEKIYDIEYYKKSSFFEKLIFKKNDYPDIYFHKGLISADAIELIENAKLVIVNSLYVQTKILKKLSHLDINKIKIVHPYYHSNIDFDKERKKEFRNKHNIDKKSKVIFFRGKDLQKCGIDVLFDVISRMYKDNFTLVIESSPKQIRPLRLQMERSTPAFSYILLEDYENIEELFIASDIFILPTSQTYFSLDVLKAMYYRNAVFLMESNHASEIIDVFSLIQSGEDRSVSFKVDSLLINKDELKKIQKENQKIALEYTLKNNLTKTSEIMKDFFDF